jgi:FMN phosphatase YigB (HAD superfamily)
VTRVDPAIGAILFDLDDTLLRNEAATYFRDYTRLLIPHLAPWLSEQQVSHLMWRGTEYMMANKDPDKLLIDCFWEYALQQGHPAVEIAPAFDRFYATDYAKLGQQTEPIAGSRETLLWAANSGYTLVLATNPLFPESAVTKRMEWAGVADLDFALVTTCENMHHAKPNPLYYREIAHAIDTPPAACLMVGNDMRFDMVAGQVGMRTYLVSKGPVSEEAAAAVDGHGPLTALRPWLEAEPQPPS